MSIVEDTIEGMGITQLTESQTAMVQERLTHNIDIGISRWRSFAQTVAASSGDVQPSPETTQKRSMQLQPISKRGMNQAGTGKKGRRKH